MPFLSAATTTQFTSILSLLIFSESSDNQYSIWLVDAFFQAKHRKPNFYPISRCLFSLEAAKTRILFDSSMPFFRQGIEN
jgi:hypothetical protein